MSLPDAHMQRRKAEKDAGLVGIAVALNKIREDRGQPDHWERVHLARGLAFIFSGCYGLASTEARLALTPRSERSPAALLPDDQVFRQFDLPFLQKVWHEAQAEPVQQFPHFGPVVQAAAPVEKTAKGSLR